ncbi:cyanate lyase [Rhodothalassium salexigens DSM 2132]|uniref:Cyanate hydratase n=1 Tax=Rhodothalassium salexigens DSM 2132 TaxID=1188247 RepID=A0A4R2PFM0_RHOSA|nr:cyanase [Rhodothalassium salexigens]MBB4211745.1 cyanate lyase [Rhodothalassium salexigens DSM 2132]MBK1639833.1 cyanase [Rhodothalassium salexigens DSM 2132]TCP33957.1 cyanate lyase [Rhodothalassium salexigens DSM 2132]
MDRDQLTHHIQDAMAAKGLSYAWVAEAAGLSPVFTTAALLGQMALPADAAARVADLLDLPEAATGLARIPSRGSLGMAVPTDPLMYRFYEIVQVYGTTLKALIEEEFGDGIMSAIDFDMAISRQPDPKGDRVKVEMTGKFLPYKKS